MLYEVITPFEQLVVTFHREGGGEPERDERVRGLSPHCADVAQIHRHGTPTQLVRRDVIEPEMAAFHLDIAGDKKRPPPVDPDVV